MSITSSSRKIISLHPLKRKPGVRGLTGFGLDENWRNQVGGKRMVLPAFHHRWSADDNAMERGEIGIRFLFLESREVFAGIDGGPVRIAISHGGGDGPDVVWIALLVRPEGDVEHAASVLVATDVKNGLPGNCFPGESC